LSKNKWSIFTSEAKLKIPPNRYGHTMNVYKDKLIIFGGAGPFNKNAKMRLCYKDMHLFDTKSLEWTNLSDLTPQSPCRPSHRMYHASAIFGNILVIHGGFDTEDKNKYGDCFLYDLDNFAWIDLKMPSQFEESGVGERCMHTMTTIISNECKTKDSLSMWCKYPKDTPD
jgi:hypothetical protein